MVKVAKGLKPLAGDSLRRASIAEYMSDHVDEFDAEFALAEYKTLMTKLEKVYE